MSEIEERSGKVRRMLYRKAKEIFLFEVDATTQFNLNVRPI